MSEISNIQTGGAAYNETAAKAKPAVTTKPAKPVTASGGEKRPQMEIAENEEKNKEAANGFNKNTVKNAVEAANGSLKMSHTSAKFKYHEATKQVSIKIIDDETQEVIKEIPPEKSIEMVEKMLELSGILVDEKR